MTVRELIAILQTHDPDRIVVLSSDGEGNSYSPLAGIGTGAYDAETTWRGAFGLEELTPEDEEFGYTEEDAVDSVPALTLWPVN